MILNDETKENAIKEADSSAKNSITGILSLDPILTLSQNDAIASHVFEVDQSPTDEEGRLVLDGVDCRDFPFEAVLSLEDTLRKDPIRTDIMRGASIKRGTASKSKSASSLNEVSQKSTLQRQQNKSATSRMTKKNRPPLLKCSTWPNSQFPDGSSDNSMEKHPLDAQDTSTESKLDSPSFYSVAAIDFSAISHLAEEHDKQIAQENAEKTFNKHSYISETTREKLYGKATQKQIVISSKSRRDLQKMQAIDIDNDTLFTLTSVPLENINNIQAYSPNSAQSIESVLTVNKIKQNGKSSKKPSKSELLPHETAIRKRYSSSPAVTVSSVPISSLQNDENTSAVVIESHPLPGNDNLATNENDEGSQKHPVVPLEKQPLPPEGFKISRYPLKKNLPDANATSAEDSNKKTEASLHRLIGELRKQLQRAEEKIAEAENQVREWKEIAQRTLQAVEVIKAQIGVNKVEAVSPAPNEAQATVKRVEVRRWSNETPVEDEGFENKKQKVSEQVIQRFLLGKNFPVEKTNGRKRALSKSQSNGKRQCLVSVESASRLSQMEDKNKSLLAWLANSGPENEIGNYMTYLEVPENKDQCKPTKDVCHDNGVNGLEVDTSVVSRSFQPIAPQRCSIPDENKTVEVLRQNSLSDDYFIVDLDSKIPSKTPLQLQNSFDRFLDTFTPIDIDLNYASDPPSLGSEGEKTPVSLPLQSPEIPSPILSQSLSDSEFHFCDDRDIGNCVRDTDYFRRFGNSENDLSAVLDDNDLLSQLDGILDF